MTSIEEAKSIVVEFLQRALDAKDVKVIRATKVDDQWHIEAEVYEENSFLKSLGLPTRVQDRNIYEVKLNDNLEVESYERQGHTLATS
jgi:alcohol dehydrogenase YqhD (iron-dependent ADH family)